MTVMRIAMLGILGLVAAGLIGGSSGQGDQELFVAVGQVAHVVDGDTFWVELLPNEDHGVPQEFIRIVNGVERVKVRPYLMSAPETPHMCYGPEAAEYAWKILFGRIVWLVHQREPSPDNNENSLPRLMALVYLEPLPDSLSTLEDLERNLGPERGTLFQALMVAQGFAKVDIRPRPEPFLQIERPFEVRMNDAKEFANRYRLGLWNCLRQEGAEDP